MNIDSAKENIPIVFHNRYHKLSKHYNKLSLEDAKETLNYEMENRLKVKFDQAQNKWTPISGVSLSNIEEINTFGKEISLRVYNSVLTEIFDRSMASGQNITYSSNLMNPQLFLAPLY